MKRGVWEEARLGSKGRFGRLDMAGRRFAILYTRRAVDYILVSWHISVKSKF